MSGYAYASYSTAPAETSSPPTVVRHETALGAKEPGKRSVYVRSVGKPGYPSPTGGEIVHETASPSPPAVHAHSTSVHAKAPECS